MGVKKTSGDYFEVPPADIWNGMVEAGIDYNDRKRLGTGGGPEYGFIPSDAIKLRNDSGGALVAGRVLEVGAKLITPTRTGLWFEGDTPSPDGSDVIAITQRPMPSNAIDWCQVSGVVLCRLNVNHVQQHYADVDSSSTLLQSKWHGRCEILWKSTASTGEQDAVVRIGQMFTGPIKVIITAASGIAAGASGNAKVLWGGVDASPTSTITVKFGHMAVGTAGLNKDALVHWIPSEQLYEITELEC